MLQFPGNDMTPPEFPDEDWWADEERDPADYQLPPKTDEELLREDQDLWLNTPLPLRQLAAALFRAHRIGEMTDPDSFISRQAVEIVRRKIPQVREYLDQLEAQLGVDLDAAASLDEPDRP